MLSREIQIEHGPEMPRFDLPRRSLGALHLIGLLSMVSALFFAWLPTQQILRSLTRMANNAGSGFEWLPVVFLTVFIILAMLPFGFGLFILAGRTQLVVTKNHIIATERAWPFRWSRKVRLDQIERLVL